MSVDSRSRHFVNSCAFYLGIYYRNPTVCHIIYIYIHIQILLVTHDINAIFFPTFCRYVSTQVVVIKTQTVIYYFTDIIVLLRKVHGIPFVNLARCSTAFPHYPFLLFILISTKLFHPAMCAAIYVTNLTNN